MPHGVGGGERVASAAAVSEQFPAFFLFGGQLDAADGHSALVLGVVCKHERRHDQAEGEREHDPGGDRAAGGLRFGGGLAAAGRVRAPPRIATKNTPRPSATQKAMMTYT